jgi:AsmA-like C-terminal region
LTAAGPAKPVATLKLDASGRASSAAGLIADLKGKGELALAEGAININAPGSLTAIADAALQGKGPVDGEELEFAVRAALKDSSQPLGGVTIPLTVGDGILRFGNVKVDAPLGRSQVNAVVELDTLKIDSEWQIEPKVQRAGAAGERVLLAPISIVYAGKLKDLTRLEPVIGMAGLERELSVRKMERDVEELERLRKLDQAQAKAEQERRKALEVERAAAAAAAKAARDAAAAAGLPPPAIPAPVLPGVQPQTLNEGAPPQASPNAAAAVPGTPAAVTAQSDGGSNAAVTEIPPAGVGAVQAEPDKTNPAARPPPVRKKRAQSSPTWKPFQVTPYQ